MIDEATLGVRDAKGHWNPNERPAYGPLFAWPPRPAALLRWFVSGYVLSWHLLYLAVAVAVWWWATPSVDTMRTFGLGWVAFVLVRNYAVIIAWYGLWHLRLYARQAQGTRTKYNAKWPRASSRFAFGHQNKDNVFWSLVSGVPTMTAYEVVGLWLFASGRIPWVSVDDHPIWFVAWFLLIPLWREAHFYAVHRLIHVPALYKPIHSLHHRNVNPGPWSGLSMHPIEHLLYFSATAITWIVPSHPLHMIFTNLHLAMAPVPGHAGFAEIELGRTTIGTHGYAHYLHHKYFEVNYADGVVPLDRWFGSFHDGSPEAMAAMRARRPTVATTTSD